ncbi:hypothetical protein [Halobellus rubicundus]|uniref:Helix-turn-helix domain-containing protein n=1 Tax=Halobellus rubicundus TaxID=2996466 RepID=A0ABD5MGV2_9EURY
MAFQPHSSFDALASVIEQLGAGGRTVRRAEAAAGDEDDALCATVEVAIPLSALADGADGGGVSLEPVDDGTDSGVVFGLELPGIDAAGVDADDGTDVSVRAVEATLGTESVAATLEIVIRSADTDDGSVVEDRVGGRDVASGAGGSFRRGSDRPRDSGESAPSPETPEAPEAEADVFGGVEPTDADDAGDSESGNADDEADGADGLAAARDESVPPYEDVAYLARLYEVCDTFAEMSERIEMDVSAETVRRYMIDADVHSPTSYELGGAGRTPDDSDDARSGSADDGTDEPDESVVETAPSDETPPDEDGSDADGRGDGGDGSRNAEAAATPAEDRTESEPADRVAPESLPDEQLVADGIGLPESLTLPDVVAAVVDARTVYDVQRELGLGHDRTRQLLRQLNVLDLVLCRASQAAAREVSVETVTARIRQCTPDGA